MTQRDLHRDLWALFSLAAGVALWATVTLLTHLIQDGARSDYWWVTWDVIGAAMAGCLYWFASRRARAHREAMRHTETMRSTRR